MSKLLRIVFLFTLTSLVVTSAWGQSLPPIGPPPPPGFGGGFFGGGSGEEQYEAVAEPGLPLGKYYRDIINGDFQDSLIDPENEFSGFSITDNIQNNIAAIHLNSNNPCTGSPTCNSPFAETQIVPGSRGIPLQALIPGSMKAESDYLWNTDAVNMSQDNLSSPQVVRDVSLFLAESAVAQGEANARMKAANLTNNTMLQNIAFSLATDKFEGSQVAYQTYYWCIQKNLKDGAGFAKAHQRCAKDDGKKSSGAGGSAGSVTGLKFSDNPGFEGSDDKKILLTAILFKEEIDTSENGATLAEVKQAFKDIYGDIEFSLGGALGGIFGGGTFGDGILENRYRMIHGVKSPADSYQLLIIEKFNSLRDIIERYCTHVNAHTALTGSASSDPSNFQRLPEKQPGADGIGNVSSEFLKRVSTPGFSMTPAIIVGIRSLYELFYLNHEKSPAPKETKLFCGPVKNVGPYKVENNGDFKKFYEELRNDGGKVFFQSLYHLSRLLALGEWLTRAAIAEQTVEFLSVGINVGGNIENLAKDLIYRTVGSRDIKFEIERVNAQLREYVLANFERTDRNNQIAAQAGANLIQDGQR